MSYVGSLHPGIVDLPFLQSGKEVDTAGVLHTVVREKRAGNSVGSPILNIAG